MTVESRHLFVSCFDSRIDLGLCAFLCVPVLLCLFRSSPDCFVDVAVVLHFHGVIFGTNVIAFRIALGVVHRNIGFSCCFFYPLLFCLYGIHVQFDLLTCLLICVLHAGIIQEKPTNSGTKATDVLTFF